ncbi:MAG: AMP-binding protein [Thermodesulfobacteriota bacterium]|nr:AMP-binding protein [Thermodesulfobacteriota bacterium]
MKSIYEQQPWLNTYHEGCPAKIQIPEISVRQAFEETTEKWKHKIAMIYYGKKITYQELREKVDRLATALSDLGIHKGDRVALLLLNCPEHVIAFYALVRIGAIIVPLSPVYVSVEIKHQLEDSGTESIICQDMLYSKVEKTEVKFKNVILSNITESMPKIKKFMGKSVLKGVYQKMAAPSPDILMQENFYWLQELIKEYPPDPPEVDVDVKKDIITLPYTSGTTGPPKGVMITNYNIIANEAQYHAFYQFFDDGKETIISYMPFNHAAGQFMCLLSGIMRGYTLVVITNPDLSVILNYIRKYNVTIFMGAPTIYESLKEHEKTDRVDWKKLKLVLSAADALHSVTSTDWKNRTGVSIYEGYGMTELTCISHMTPLDKIKPGSVGVPLPNILAAVLDPDKDEYMPAGELGEIVVSAPQSTIGYWKNPEATKDCESIINGIRWWRTGDLGKMDEDGYFYYYDRKRDLIKYKGLRVYAREVEEVLKTHPQIKEVGLIGVPDIKVGENVKAYVVCETEARGNLSEQDIIDYCQGKLSHYKIPKIVEFVGEIPKTDVGKVSRRELRTEDF